jgi:hypothetical protein
MNLPLGSWCLRLALALATAESAFALSPSISPENPKSGQKITLTYKINDPISIGGGRPSAPESINAGGIIFTRQQMKESRFGGYNYLRATYSGVAGESGRFVIPSKTFRLGGKKFTSEARSFRVRGAAPAKVAEKPLPDFARSVRSAPPAPRPSPVRSSIAVAAPPARPSSSPKVRPTPASSPSAPPRSAATAPPAAPRVSIGKGSMEIPGGEIFVGQAVPVILRFPLRADDQYDGLTRPLLAGDGFTSSGFRELPATQLVTNGTAYNVISLAGSVAPFRAGTLKIPDLVLKGRRLAAGSFRPPAPGQFPAPSGGGWQDFQLSATGRDLKVSELPEQDRPAHFTGAIGSFGILPLEVSPKEAAEGQPVTLKVSLKGPGNLESVSALRLVDADGWRVRGPKEEMLADGDVKTFEFTLFARSEQKNSPSASLVYFDPGQKKYLTLDWPAVPLYAAGAGEGSGFEAVTQKKPPKPSVVAVDPDAVGAVPQWFDFLGAAWGKARPLALGLLSLFVFTLLFFWAARFFLRRRREANEALKAALSKAWDQLEESGQNPAAFYAAAAAVISSRLALWRGKAGAFDDTVEQLNRLVSNVPLREELTAILARRDELNYGAEESAPPRPSEHAAVCATLEKFCEDVT